MMAEAIQQLIFDLPHRVARGRADFLVAGSNARAVEMIDRWPDWPSRIIILTGPAASGKTHLASVWQKTSGAHFVDDGFLSGQMRPAFPAPLLADDFDRKIKDVAEEDVFLFFNQVIHSGAFLLLTAVADMPLWQKVKLPDLRSRLRAAPVLTLDPPDEALIGAVMIKMFSDRQMDIPDSVIGFLLARMERSFEMAHKIVAMMDREAMMRRKPITIALAREALSQIALS